MSTHSTLTAAAVTRRAEDVVLTWDVDGDLDAGGPWLLATTLIGGEDGPIHQFGFRGAEGGLGVPFFFDGVAAQNFYTPAVSPQRVGKRWTAVFPAGDEVARAGKWRAALTFDDDSSPATETTAEGTF